MLSREQKIALVERSSPEGIEDDGSGEVIVSASWVQTITPGVRSFYANRVYRSVLEPGEADAKIAATVEMYRARGLSLQWIVSPGSRPLDLGEWLLAAGFRLATTAAGLFATVDETRVGASEGVTVDEIDERGLGEWLEVQAAGWQIPPAEIERLRAMELRRLRSPRERALYALGRIGGAPAGGAAIDLHDGFAYLRSAVVLPEHRRRGVFRAVMASLLDRLKAREVPYATGYAIKETSAPILTAMGFEQVCDICYYEISP